MDFASFVLVDVLADFASCIFSTNCLGKVALTGQSFKRNLIIMKTVTPLLFSHDLIRTLVLHLTLHHIFKVLLMNRGVFFGLLDLFTDCLSSLYIQNTGIA
jgi:hypothetical protein